jgi:hypothetical protein
MATMSYRKTAYRRGEVPGELQNKLNTSPVHHIQDNDAIPSVLN